ncbi:MAG TPA: glycosyltransferase [Acidimicrobiia bacterium]|nr:glycosyltransferase [Acidimicrobiia bacterium]
MLESVDIGAQSIDSYEPSAGKETIATLRELAAPLRGLRVLHVSATPYGGGVAEILRSKIPLLRDLGLAADWKLISGDAAFFRATKAIHNGLQGSETGLSSEDEQHYLMLSARNAAALDERYDVVVVHDPQPLPLLELGGSVDSRWVWRCHIDTSEPNPEVWAFVQPFLVRYDAAVFTLGGFVPPGFPVHRVEIIPPAIDPESPKNLELGSKLAARVVEWIGIRTTRPFVTQISRFDRWKDPFGVVAAYRLVREDVPDLQLALVGSMALDDPEGWDVYRDIQREVEHDPDVHVFTNLTGVGNIEVNAFQRLADVVIQKSIREGFGLVVSEALWKGTPVVAGRAGGIPLQLQDGVGGYLVDSVDECAERVRELVLDAARRRELGERGRALVAQRFLLTRLLADELRLYASVQGSQPAEVPGRMLVGLAAEHRDPVCGMSIDTARARRLTVDGRDHFFCSGTCEEEFAADPERFLRAVAILPHVRRARRWFTREHGSR